MLVQLTPFGANPNQCYFLEFTDPDRQFTVTSDLDKGSGGGVLVVQGQSVSILIPSGTPLGSRQIRVAPVVGNPVAGPNDPDALQIVGAFSVAVNVSIVPEGAGQSDSATPAPGSAPSEVRVMRQTSKPVRPVYSPTQAPLARRAK